MSEQNAPTEEASKTKELHNKKDDRTENGASTETNGSNGVSEAPESTSNEQGETPNEEVLDVAALFREKEVSEFAQEDGEGVILGEFELDVGNLLVFDRQQQPKDVSPKELAQRCVQQLFEQVFNLPTTQSEAGPVAALPTPTTPIPREKPLPKAKPLTRWEKYAKEKGIKKRKRDRLVWDPISKEYKPRYGGNRAINPAEDVPIIEHNAAELERYGAEDPFILQKMKKKERLQKQKRREVVNRRRAAAEEVSNLPATVDITTNAPRRQVRNIERALKLAQTSTASIGKFDEHLSDEPVIKRKPKHAPIQPEEERKKSLKIVESVLKKTAAESLDVARAATLHIRDEERKIAAEKKSSEKKPLKRKKAPAGKAKAKATRKKRKTN